MSAINSPYEVEGNQEIPLLLEVNGVVGGYGVADVLQGANVRVQRDALIAVIGPNGAGKSTLLKAIIGLVKCRAGTISFDGEQITKLSVEARVDLGISYVPQLANIFPSLTVRENLIVGRRGTRQGDQDEQIGRALEMFPILRDRMGVSARYLSGGERQMLALAQSLVSAPVLVLLDEPTAALAPKVADQIFASILEMHAEGISIVLVEQNVKKALQIASLAYVFESGREALVGPSAELMTDPRMASLYLGGGLKGG